MADLERNNDAVIADEGSGEVIAIHTPALQSSSTMVPGEKAHSASASSADKDPSLVEFEGPDDPLNPQNLPQWKKWLYAHIIGWLSLVVTFATSVFSTATGVTAEEFGVAREVMVLGTALFIAGFAAGPILFGPLSELYGRKRPMLWGYAIFVIFQIPVGVAQNVETIIICRFLGGVAASGPLSIAGGYFADFFDPVSRGLALAIFAGTTFIGPIIGPIVGGFITESYLGWRWTAWITMIMAATSGIISVIFLPETYAPVLLQRKASRLRLETKNWALHAKLDESPVNLQSILTRYLSRPLVMLLKEPILQLITLYMTFIYGFIYLLFEAYPISFTEERNYSLGIGALPFLSIGLGVILGSAYIFYFTQTRIRTTYNTTGQIRPEERLYPMIPGAILFPLGQFWFAWTSFPGITPWPQILAGVPLGAGMQIIYLQGLAYLVDVYLVYANSAISANALVRSTVAAGFTMFATPMYHRLGVRWASSLLGFLGVAFIPVPIVFYIYGERIRKLSRFSPA
ncbi:major facilitator superfamily domain-containing protein [Aspergillus carlsbadensis]|nr:major facilitator superfamily domain-containing protein [Aspergillus carlsbadensis]